MKNRIIYFLLSLFLFTACSEERLAEEATYDPREEGSDEICAKSDSILSVADRIFMSENWFVELYVQNGETNEMKKVPNFDVLPKVLKAYYNVIRYSNGEIMYVVEFDTNKEGKYEHTYESLFDEEGNLIEFIRKSTFTGSECTGEAFEKSEYYYNSSHDLIKKTYALKDAATDVNIMISKCKFKYRTPYEIYTTREEWLKAHNLEK